MEAAFYGSAGKNRKSPSIIGFSATKPQVAEVQNRGLVGRSRFYPALPDSLHGSMRQIPKPPSTPPFSRRETAGRGVAASRCALHILNLQHTSGFASVAGRVHSYHRLDKGQNRQFRFHTKTPAGAKLLLPALACLLVLFSACAEARFGPLRLRGLHAQLVADEFEGRGDGLVHVVVLVAAQATGEDHVALLRRQLLVLLVEGLVLGVVDGVVGLVAGFPVGRVLARDDGLVLRAELEVLVLDDARVGDLALGVVDHGHALVVLLVERLGLKAQAAVLQRAQLKVVERVDGAAVDRLGGDIGLGGGQLLVLHAAAHLDALEHVGDHLGVASHGDALVAVVEVVVVVGKAAGESFDNARGQVAAVAAPLLLGVALHERFEDVASHEGQRLLLKVGRLADVLGGHLLGDLCLCVRRRDDARPHLGEGVHVEGHVVHVTVEVGDRRVDVVVELGEAVDVVPDVLHGGVEDMRAVAVDLDALDVLGVDVAGDVVAAVDDQDRLAGALGGVGKDGARKAGTDDEVIVLGHGYAPLHVNWTVTLVLGQTNLIILSHGLV